MQLTKCGSGYNKMNFSGRWIQSESHPVHHPTNQRLNEENQMIYRVGWLSCTEK